MRAFSFVSKILNIFVSDIQMKICMKSFSHYVLVKIELFRILLKNNLLDEIKNLVVVYNVFSLENFVFINHTDGKSKLGLNNNFNLTKN